VVVDKALDPDKEVGSGGVIYTDEMPSLEALLERYGVQRAIIERPVPVLQAPPAREKEVEPEHRDPLDFRLILALGGIPSGVFAAGIFALLGALLGGSVFSNAYIALLLVFGGIALGATARAAVREASRG